MGDKSYRVGPVSMPVSPEFAYRGDEQSGRETLLQMARMTGGSELVDIAPLFQRRNTTVATKPMVTPLLILMLLALLGEIAESRFGLLQGLKSRFAAGAVGQRAAAIRESIASGWEARHERRATRRKLSRAQKQTAGQEAAAARREAAAARKAPADEPATGGKASTVTAATATKSPKAPPAPTPEPEGMDYLAGVKARARRSMKDRKQG